MESYLPISQLNDFIFCPLSIYFHQLYGEVSTRLYHDTPQINGKAAHTAIDERRYSTHRDMLQSMEVYSVEYRLCGKIDLFDLTKGLLTERKKKITTIYDGYIFQLYAQYFCLTEMGYAVQQLRFYSSDTNKIFPIKLPAADPIMRDKFFALIDTIHNFSLADFKPENAKKCAHCIYQNFCDRPLC